MPNLKELVNRLEELQTYKETIISKPYNEYDKLHFSYGGENFDLSDCNKTKILNYVKGSIDDRIDVLRNQISDSLYPQENENFRS